MAVPQTQAANLKFQWSTTGQIAGNVCNGRPCSCVKFSNALEPSTWTNTWLCYDSLVSCAVLASTSLNIESACVSQLPYTFQFADNPAGGPPTGACLRIRERCVLDLLCFSFPVQVLKHGDPRRLALPHSQDPNWNNPNYQYLCSNVGEPYGQ
jgi:hypothetical protein